MRSKLAALTALTIVTASTAAVAQSAGSLSVAPAARAGETAHGSSELVGTTAWILAAIALGLIIWGIIELTGDDDDFPTSP